MDIPTLPRQVPHSQAPYKAWERAEGEDGFSTISGREDAKALVPSRARRLMIGFVLRA